MFSELFSASYEIRTLLLEYAIFNSIITASDFLIVLINDSTMGIFQNNT